MQNPFFRGGFELHMQVDYPRRFVARVWMCVPMKPKLSHEKRRVNYGTRGLTSRSLANLLAKRCRSSLEDYSGDYSDFSNDEGIRLGTTAIFVSSVYPSTEPGSSSFTIMESQKVYTSGTYAALGNWMVRVIVLKNLDVSLKIEDGKRRVPKNVLACALQDL